MWSTALSIAIAVSTLTACASSMPPSADLPPPSPPASLLTPCPALYQIDSPELRTLVIVTVENARLYHECQARHRRLAQWAADPEGLIPAP